MRLAVIVRSKNGIEYQGAKYKFQDKILMEADEAYERFKKQEIALARDVRVFKAEVPDFVELR